MHASGHGFGACSGYFKVIFAEKMHEIRGFVGGFSTRVEDKAETKPLSEVHPPEPARYPKYLNVNMAYPKI